MSDAYDIRLGQLAKQIAESLGCANYLREGVYCMLAGPTYETIAECKMLQLLGADAVGKWKTYKPVYQKLALEFYNSISSVLFF